VLKRIVDYRPTWDLNVSEPVSGNYYPVSNKLSLVDVKQGKTMTVIPDRAQGGTVIRNGVA